MRLLFALLLAVPVLLEAPDGGTAAAQKAAANTAAQAGGAADAGPRGVSDGGSATQPRLTPPPALGELRPLLGNWPCTGKARLAPGAPEVAVRSSWTFALELDGFWVAASYLQEKTAATPQPVKARGHFGYDDEQDRFVAGLAVNDGTAEQSSSAGWEGDRLIFSGQYKQGEDRLNFRRTFERLDAAPGSAARVLHATLELQLAAPDWVTVLDETCSIKP